MSPRSEQQTIAGLEPPAAVVGAVVTPIVVAGRVARVLPDVLGIDKEFDYLVPEGAEVHVGDVVRVKLGGRRVGGWITALDVDPVPGMKLISLAKVSGRGPAPDLVELAGWAAWRWSGRRANFLRSATPPAVVRSLPAPSASPAVAPGVDQSTTPLFQRALALERGVLRLPPGADRYALVLAAVQAEGPVVGGHTLVLCPSVAEAQTLGRRLRRDGVRTAIVAHEAGGVAAAGEWARAWAGAVVVGARAAAWAPVARLGRVVVLDEHDEVYQEEASPTWHARDVVAERARRAGAPCLLVSPTPTLEALGWGDLVVPGRGEERAGWPRVEVIDQRELDPSLGPLFSPMLVNLVRGPGRILCILNRTGRARLLACTSCATLARCAVCEAAVGQADQAEPDSGDRPGQVDDLLCGRCGTRRPMVCLACGGARFKNLRLGVSKAREELEVLAGEPVVEVTGASVEQDSAVASARLLIGTEALLHRVARADAVAFLDFDQELLALRYRAGEQALGLLARAGRLVQRGSGDRGRILVQTRTPDHPALMAARHADPGRLVEGEQPLRVALGLPPAVAMAVVSGQAAPAFMADLGEPAGVVVQGPLEGAWRLRAPNHQVLCDALATVARPPGRLRVEVDPLGI